ncbi:MAG: YhbY family RNA-binding protein [Oscillochloris sp.]|nr:YhbY family RNA-binding protein [Oscillochloris sp.]
MTNNQRSYLRRLAHPLKPTAMIGKHGLTESIATKIDQELDAHELIKLRFLDFKDQRRELTETIVAETQSTLVALIGNVAILFRSHRDPEQRRIMLPVE